MSFNILIVEDDDSIRKLIKRILFQSGLAIEEIYEARDGWGGWDLLKSRRIDFVLVDLHMPGMNGAELVKKIRSDSETSKIPFIFISAEKRPEYIDLLKEKGCGFISKPFAPDRLASTIVDLLSLPYN